MKRTYDVIGSGEGISVLFACALLAGKGLSCLHIDTTPVNPGTFLWPDTPLLVTESFFQGMMEAILKSFGPSAMRSLGLRHVQVKKWSNSNEITPPDPDQSWVSRTREAGMCREYVALLQKSAERPQNLWREMRRSMPRGQSEQAALMSALSSGGVSRASYLHSLASSLGVCSMEYGKIEGILGAHLNRHNGNCIQDPESEFMTSNGETLGVRLGGAVYKARHYLTEDPFDSGKPDGFFLYGRCEAIGEAVATKMGDRYLVLPPPEDLDFPIVMRAQRGTPRTNIIFSTRVRSDSNMISLLEIFSWASGMVFKLLSRIFSSMEGSLLGYEAVNPLLSGTIRPYFRFTEKVKVPSFFTRRHYITPQERLYACDRDKYACLGGDGEFFWGICIANAILRDLGRSDLITVKAARGTNRG